MSILHRASLKFGAKSPWLRLRVSRNRSSNRDWQQHQRQQQRNTSTKSEPQQPPSSRPGANNGGRGAQGHAESTSPKVEPVDIPIQLWYHRLGPVSTFFNWFHKTQLKRPYTVQLCTTLTTYFAGDLLAQDLGGERYDGKRTLRMLFIGAIAAVPGYKW